MTTLSNKWLIHNDKCFAMDIINLATGIDAIIDISSMSQSQINILNTIWNVSSWHRCHNMQESKCCVAFKAQAKLVKHLNFI